MALNRDDTLWKGILENVFDDFLRFFFADADALFDMREFQYLDKELEQLFPVQDEEATRFVDKLVKVFTKGGGEEWILVHVEVQGYDDRHFGRRMFTYFYRILDRYYQIAEQDEEALKSDNNPFAAVVLTVLLALKRRKTDESLYNLKYTLARNLLQKQFSRVKIGNILVFLQLYVRFAIPPITLNLIQQLRY